MAQTVLSVTLEVEPESCERLSDLIVELRHFLEAATPQYSEQYDRLKTGVPVLHFMSLNVFPSADYDPLFVIEANFDGPACVFWGQLEATLGPQLRDMLRCCKKPADGDGDLYTAATAADSRYPIAPYLEARSLKPSAFHQGNRGLTRDRILDEGKLFAAARDELAKPGLANSTPYWSMNAQEIHWNLRKALLPRFPWLDQVPTARISAGETIQDLLRVLVFLLLIPFFLSLPGLLVLAPLQILLPGWWGILLASWQKIVAVAAPLVGYLAVLAGFFYVLRKPRRGEEAPNDSGGLTLFDSRVNRYIAIGILAVYLAIYGLVAFIIGVAAEHLITGHPYQEFWRPTLLVVGLGLASASFVTLPIILLLLRWLERRDSFHDRPAISEGLLREMARREDWIPQNHMGSIVLVKPGVLRMLLFRIGHYGLGILARLLARDGYLGSMRTIHFAHWAFVNNKSRLMFFSNFDQSWESYLDDFIEKAHGGLTLAWSSGVGFPPTRFLVLDGASHGRKFKAWARHSMAVSRFWFSAYRNFTVNQIERQNRIANGLRKLTLTEKEAVAWARDL